MPTYTSYNVICPSTHPTDATYSFFTVTNSSPSTVAAWPAGLICRYRQGTSSSYLNYTVPTVDNWAASSPCGTEQTEAQCASEGGEPDPELNAPVTTEDVVVLTMAACLTWAAAWITRRALKALGPTL